MQNISFLFGPLIAKSIAIFDLSKWLKSDKPWVNIKTYVHTIHKKCEYCECLRLFFGIISIFSSSDKGYITVETEENKKSRLINGFWKLYYLKLAKSVAKFLCLHIHILFASINSQATESVKIRATVEYTRQWNTLLPEREYIVHTRTIYTLWGLLRLLLFIICMYILYM